MGITTMSYWEAESFYAPKDVVIIGSGFVGLWSAYYLKKMHPHLSISIVDRGIIPAGASTRNAGFACFGSVTELLSDSEKMGDEKMLELVGMRFRGLKKIRKLFKDRAIGYEDSGGFELIANSQGYHIDKLRSQIDRLNHQLRDITQTSKTFALNDGLIGRFGLTGVDHLIENKLEGQLHSGFLCQCLLLLVQSMGIQVFNQIEVRRFEKTGAYIEVISQLPWTLKARKLLICTNAFAKELLNEVDVIPARGQVLVTSPIRSLSLEGCFHYDEGFYYFRNVGKRLLLGGARNKAFEAEQTTEFSTTDLIQQELESFMRDFLLKNVKESYTIDYRWSGIMGVGPEKMPIVREIRENVFCAVRMSGMGVALAPEIGKEVAKMMAD